MLNRCKQENDRSEPMIYQIRIKGHLSQQWMEWFEGLTISLEDNGYSLLTGEVPDQAALHRLLRKVRDLGMDLYSVIPIILESSKHQLIKKE